MEHSNVEATRNSSTFSLQYDVSIEINAEPETIWPYLVNAADYPNWNSTVDRVEGEIAEGEKIKVFAKISPNRAFPVVVSHLEPPKKMVWTGGMPLGLFKGVRTFLLTPGADGNTTVSMSEQFTGLMVPLMAGSMPDLRPAFIGFAADLKTVAEGKVS
ncbi:MAG: SRPBCC domain-containing protein [Saprospiraceae bacterium]|nr:SRPBCC domain-containing protein [Lewinella sp.]